MGVSRFTAVRVAIQSRITSYNVCYTKLLRHARLDKNPGNLIPGMYVSGHIHTDENNTRTLPNNAVVAEGTKSYIFILDESVEARNNFV